ncbi:IQ calmodulin-binding motif-containing protein 1 [Latimeria chalumnae]|uniref:IQ calmodulin-binding motif-containing protein 1 n=1 Tax=Latimeria chalumnae TaxID=7897 RepID=UPI00313CBBD3
MSERQPAEADPRVLNLAAEVAETSNQQLVPLLLLKIKDIFDGVLPGSKESKKLKEDIYYYDLVQYCILVLTQDYSRIHGGWATAAKLAEVLSNCCVGLDPKEDTEEFYSKVLPSAADNLLLLARRLQARFVRAIKDEEKTEFLRHFRVVTDAVCWLFGGQSQLTEHVLQSDHFLQLLLTDDVETGTAMMSVLQNIVRVNSIILSKVEKKTIHSILDELVYELSATTNPVTGSAATKSLLLMAESHDPVVQMLCTRYKGLRALLNKQWTGRGFGRELSRLLDLLYAGSYRQAEMQRLNRAACSIQAAWKAYRTRKRLKKLPIAVTSLQRSFRAKREQELLRLKKQKAEEDLRQQLQLQRQQAMRQFRQRQLVLLEIVPAAQVSRHMQELEEISALRIQKHWRGHRERRHFHQQKQVLRQFKAAVTIQRAVLKFLEKCRKKKKVLSPWKGPIGLTDARRQELRQTVDEHIKLHPVPPMSEERSKELHLKCQELLGQYLLKRNFHRTTDQQREALLAQINTDVELLMNAPGLKEATGKDRDVFSTRSMPVAARARQSHNTMLRFNRWPWWKKLGDEFLDPEAIPPEDVDVELGTLFLGGSKVS